MKRVVATTLPSKLSIQRDGYMEPSMVLGQTRVITWQTTHQEIGHIYPPLGNALDSFSPAPRKYIAMNKNIYICIIYMLEWIGNFSCFMARLSLLMTIKGNVTSPRLMLGYCISEIVSIFFAHIIYPHLLWCLLNILCTVIYLYIGLGSWCLTPISTTYQ